MRVLRFMGWLVGIALTAMLGLWLVQDNSTQTPLVLLGFPLGSLPLGIWLLLAFVAGALAAMLASLPVLVRLRWRARRLQREPKGRHDVGTARHP